VIERARAESRFLSVLATLLSVLALQLALGGIYGVLSYSVVLRTSEIGIRMAVGAKRMQIMRLILAEGFVSVALGTATGVVLSVVSMPLLGHLLFGITPDSLQNYGLATTALLLLSGLSMLIPALRAMNINPLTALACE
jgi:ABC-type antimicrobial peptide transport system permease subunit